MIRLVGQLLTLARQEPGAADTQRAPVALDAVAADVVAELQAARLGEPLQNTGAKPSVSDSSTRGQALDSSLYNGA